MITRNHIFNFIDKYFISPIVRYLEDISLGYDIGDPKADKYWNLAFEIDRKYRHFKFRHGYIHTPKPIAPWLRSSIMAYCDLSEEDVKKCGEYFRK